VIDGVGIGCEPASAASLAGLKKLRAEGVILTEHTAVGLLTGNILKDTDAVTSYHFEDVNGLPRAGANRPLRVAAELSALEQALADALHG
jgi:threonine synthase